jgi:hypothetical protein
MPNYTCMFMKNKKEKKESIGTNVNLQCAALALRLPVQNPNSKVVPPNAITVPTANAFPTVKKQKKKTRHIDVESDIN